MIGHVAFRVDASTQIGTGHVMRCLTLALGLAERGASVQFICRSHDGNLINLIEHRGFDVFSLPANNLPMTQIKPSSLDSLPAHAHWLGCDWYTDAEQCSAVINKSLDWIIVDHYSLDYRWEAALRHLTDAVMCIDDLADRAHHCDMLLDQNLGRTINDYSHLTPNQTKFLLGPKYALLRPEFDLWRDISLARRKEPQLRHILITMGGVDLNNVTGKILNALQKCDIENRE